MFKGVLCVVFFFLFLNESSAHIEAQCSPIDWFWYNTKNIFYNPVVNRLNYVLYTTKTDFERKPIHGYDTNHQLVQRCQEVGVVHGIDSLQVYIKVLFGITLSHWIPFLPVSNEMVYFAPVLDICNQISSIQNAPTDFKIPLECKIATDMLRCSILNAYWVIPWIIVIVLLITLLIGLMLCMSIALQ